jgi:uncharacterized protein (TIGR00290 family)
VDRNPHYLRFQVHNLAVGGLDDAVGEVGAPPLRASGEVVEANPHYLRFQVHNLAVGGLDDAVGEVGAPPLRASGEVVEANPHYLRFQVHNLAVGARADAMSHVGRSRSAREVVLRTRGRTPRTPTSRADDDLGPPRVGDGEGENAAMGTSEELTDSPDDPGATGQAGLRSIDGVPFVCSWSGGKDSALALHQAIAAGGHPRALLTMMIEDGTRSRSHGLPREVLEAQAAALGVPLHTRPASWDDYEQRFGVALAEQRSDGVRAGVFGDIDVERNLTWVQRMCAAASVQACEPLWHRPRRELLDELLALGFRARMVAVNADLLPADLLGRLLDHALVAELEAAGVDASGELGEYHTVVEDGPPFTMPVPLVFGEVVTRSGYHFIDTGVA